MATARLVISAGGPAGLVCPRFVAAIVMLFILPTHAGALDARLRWRPPADAGVQGYNVYVRQATRPYGAPRDAGAAQRASDGTLSWTLTGLSPTTNYFIALTAYTAGRVESALSNELSLGSPDPCVQDTCTSPTQCTVRPLPDGSACAPPGATGCGETCLAGVCSGLAERGFALDRLRLKRSEDQLRVAASGRFTTSALFDPLSSGLVLRVVDGAGAVLMQATLAPADLVAKAGGRVIKVLRRRGAAGPRVRRLSLRIGGDETLIKTALLAPPPAALPASASLVVEAGDLCLTGPSLACISGNRTVSCRD